MNDARLQILTELLTTQFQHNGLTQTAIPEVIAFRETNRSERHPVMYDPTLVVVCQGRKNVFLNGRRYNYGAGQGLLLFAPMVVECEYLEVPVLGFAVRLDRHKLSGLVLRMENAVGLERQAPVSPSGIATLPLPDRLLDTSIRLLQALANPMETAILGEQLVEELYFRLLSEEAGSGLRELLRQRGPVQQIGEAVDYLHKNLDKNIPVEQLASHVCMSVSGFHKRFKDVMHLSPLQYVKLIRLNRARTYLAEGRAVGEVGTLVGYNSPAQFSREYKRQFGFAPSATPSL